MVRTSRPIYRPDLVHRDTGVEQRFVPNLIRIDDSDEGTRLAFGELVPRPGRPLDEGTPVHSLIIQLPPDTKTRPRDPSQRLTVQLNDQANERDHTRLLRWELSPMLLRVVFAEGVGPFAGRVSLSPEIDVLHDAAIGHVQLGSVAVAFAQRDWARQRGLKKHLQRCADLCVLSVIAS